MKNNNVGFVKTKNGGTAFAVIIEKEVFEKVEKFLARGEKDFHRNPKRCVIPAYDSAQTVPLRRSADSYGYDSLPGAMVSVMTGWHFIKPFVRPLYYANSEGLRLIAKFGSPRKAYNSLGN